MDLDNPSTSTQQLLHSPAKAIRTTTNQARILRGPEAGWRRSANHLQLSAAVSVFRLTKTYGVSIWRRLFTGRYTVPAFIIRRVENKNDAVERHPSVSLHPKQNSAAA